jgi:peptidoglycan/LPS O-acetylase OafA/YrhL
LLSAVIPPDSALARGGALLFTKPISAAFAETTPLPDYPLFDWLRFVLASIVALGHARVITWPHSGNLAVQVFFALSGFLIGGMLLRSEAPYLPRFFFNRATRIWIPYFLAVALLYAVSATRDLVNLRWWEFLFYDVTFTHNWFSLRPEAIAALGEMPLKGAGNHFWSIAVEEQFYLVAPLFIVVLGVARNSIFWLIAPAVFVWFGLTDFASISLGVLAAHAALETRARTLAAVCALGISLPTLVLGGSYQISAPIFSIGVVLLCSTTGTRTGAGQFFGGISYPMYLNHWLGLFVAHGLNKRLDMFGPLLEGLLGYVGGVLAGTVAYICIDRVVLAKRASYYSHRNGVAAATAAYAAVLIGLSFGLWRWP